MEQNVATGEIFAFPASAAQRRLWILSRFKGANEAYNIIGALKLEGDFRPEIFERSLAFVAERHESLRTTFEPDGMNILQLVHPHKQVSMPVITINEAQEEEKIRQLIREEATTPFDLEKGPLYRIRLVKGKQANYLLCSLHHIIADGWSMEVFIRELSLAYNALLHEQIPALPPVTLQYSDYAVWQHELETNGGMDESLRYWTQRLHGAPPLLELPVDNPRPPMQTFEGQTFEYPLDKEVTRTVTAACRQYETTPFVLLLAAFKVLLRQYTGEKDIVTGTPVANRERKELAGIIGFFVNMVPIRSQLSDDTTFETLLNTLKIALAEDLDHQQVPFEKLVEQLPYKRAASYHPIFQVLFGMQAFEDTAFTWEGGKATFLPVDIPSAKFDLSLTIRKDGTAFTAVWEYNTALFEPSSIRKMAIHYQQLLQQLLQQPQQPVAGISFLDKEERKQLLVDWNKTGVEIPVPHCFHEWFVRQALCAPARTAVIDDKRTLTYQELNRWSNRLAHYLLSQHITSGQPVGVSLERNSDMLIALLAIMKAGGVYVPIDPAYPAERKQYIMQDAGINCLLTHLRLQEQPAEKIKVIYMDETDAHWKNEQAAPVQQQVAAEDPVYIIYTSGSTGQPKGVRIPHIALMNLLHSMQRKLKVTADDRLLAVTSLSFDIAGLEVYLPLLTGATVVVAARNVTQNGIALAKMLEEHNITIMQATPATWMMLLDAGWKGKPDLTVICCGEAFPRELANRLLTGNSSVWNGYGPTETTIFSAVSKVTESHRSNVPIGRPVDNTTLYILDEQLQPLPPGMVGSLYIGGRGLAIDYYNQPALTTGKFIADPFRPGERIYNTGDRARYLPDGNIEYFGRADYQVKVNGYRIETEEITYHLSQQEGVAKVVVTVRKDSTAMNRLVAYIVPDNPGLTPDVLRNALLKKLPVYMIPAFFVFLEKLPLTPNGKIDRNALPEPDLSHSNFRREYVAPQTKEEKLLADVWQEILGTDRIGIHDNFFDLGGASLQSIGVVMKMAEQGYKMFPETLFEFQTIQELASALTPFKEGEAAADKYRLQTLSFTADMLYQQGQPAANDRETLRINIESFHAYLPERIMTSKEVLNGCVNTVRFPMEKLTGVKARHVTAEDECTFGMAAKAMERCFEMSRYTPADIDVLITCSIFRMDGQERLVLEPSMAARLAAQFRCNNALTFDISNACAGIFSGLLLADNYIRTGRAARVMLVSGEYLTHLTQNHLPEIKDYLDLGIAALTLGDSGLAMVLEPTNVPGKGFVDIDLFTMGAYSDLCVVRSSKHGAGLLVRADAIGMMDAGHMETARHALQTMIKNRWQPEQVDFLLMHQASSIAIANTRIGINRFLGKELAHANNVIDNISHRGNTATTTHWIALQDHILKGTIPSQQNFLMYISGSGLNIGTALYGMDDLPDRIRQYWETGIPAEKKQPDAIPLVKTVAKRTRIKARALSAPISEAGEGPSALRWATNAAVDCLAQVSGLDRADIGLVFYTGVHRDDHIYEPAIATMICGNLNLNAYNGRSQGAQLTFGIDLLNGNLGFLQACYTAGIMMETGRTAYALVCTGEMENNTLNQQSPAGIYEGGAAWLLEQSTPTGAGLGECLFESHPELLEHGAAWVQWTEGHPLVSISSIDAYNKKILPLLKQLATRLLKTAGITPAGISYIIPHFADPATASALASKLGWKAPVIRLPEGPGNRQTLTLPQLLDACEQQYQPHQGQISLILSAAAGGQLGAALYYH